LSGQGRAAGADQIGALSGSETEHDLDLVLVEVLGVSQPQGDPLGPR